MSDFVSSYYGLFLEGPERPAVSGIEVPLIQRDYAQGRQDAKATRIRHDFVRTLKAGLTGEDQVGLDFVYGDLDGSGTFRPIDGQQRLTTLFLVHWYVAYRLGRLDGRPAWTRFSYATREGARVFCQRIVDHPPATDETRPAEWIQDQPWYRFLWQHDPTIQSMLVMITTIHEELATVDLDTAWSRLTDDARPAVTLHVLPVEDMRSADALYIKMNSRGKPLTDFETFKARLEQWVEWSPRAHELATKIDGAWSDLLWPFNDDDTVDDEFLGLLEYVVQLCEWRAGRTAEGDLADRAKRTFAHGSEEASADLDLLFALFDCWEGDAMSFFDETLTIDRRPGRLHLFTTADHNLMRLCARRAAGTQRFGNAEALLLWAVLVHKVHGTHKLDKRLRVVRNLVAASEDEIRPQAMSALVREVELVMKHGDLTAAKTFNRAQSDDERHKHERVQQVPDMVPHLQELEDHDVLRGSLMAFDLGSQRLGERASSFADVMQDRNHWQLLTGALLTKGDYSRPNRLRYPDKRRFGSPADESVWRELLTGTSRDNLRTTGTCLERVLDDVSGSSSRADALEDAVHSWLSQQTVFGWRYYLVRYAEMREGASGLYVCPNGQMGFDIRMLHRTVWSSNHREPFVYAAWRRSGIGDAARDPVFFGHQTDGCWLVLPEQRVRLRNRSTGWEVAGTDGALPEAAREVMARHDVGDDNLLRVQQGDDGTYDLSDRVELAASLLKDLVDG